MVAGGIALGPGYAAEPEHNDDQAPTWAAMSPAGPVDWGRDGSSEDLQQGRAAISLGRRTVPA
jgi:hypothetical protein